MVDEKVTVYDDGLDPEGLQVPFDFEGIAKKRVTFFDRGVAKGVTYDSFTAGREGKKSTGHGLIAPNTEGPIPDQPFYEGGRILFGGDGQIGPKGNLCDPIPLHQCGGTDEGRHHGDDPRRDFFD